MSGVPLKVLYLEDLPDQWQAVHADDVHQEMARCLGIEPTALSHVVAFSGPQCKESMAYLNFVASVHDQNHCPGNQSLRALSGDLGPPKVPITISIESPATWISARPGNSINQWVRHLQQHGHPPFSSLVRVVYNRDYFDRIAPAAA